MQDSRKNNVVELSQFGHGRAAAGGDKSALLNECGELAANALASALNKTLEIAAAELLELIDRVSAYEMRRLYDEALDFAKDQRANVEADFRRGFYQRFKRECRRDGNNRGAGALSLDSTQLSLVEPDDLEETLAASTVENALNNSCGEELFGLAKRVGVLLDDPEMQQGLNPIGPEVIGAAVMETIKGRGLPVKVQLVLVPLINKFLPNRVREVYQNLNRHLVDRGVLPTIRVGVGIRRPAPPTPPPVAPQTPGEMPAQASAVEAMGGEGQDLLSALRQLMTLAMPTAPAYPAAGVALPTGVASGPGWAPGGLAMPGLTPGGLATPGQMPGAAAAPAALSNFLSGGDLPAVAVPATVLNTLTSLQRGQGDGMLAAGFSAASLADGQVNILREIRASPVAGNLGQMDAMTLDIVSMVFDYVLDDRRIPDALKALIGRLQIPVLKVAMLDRNFFSQKSHPARRLLDVLANASMGWDENEGHDGGLYRKMDELVQRVISQFDDQVDLFATVLEEFQAYEAEEKQRIDELTSKSAQMIRQMEQSEASRVLARSEVDSHLFDQAIPEFIRSFLMDHWEKVVAMVGARHGEGSAEWQAALATMDDLIWSVTPKINPDDRKKLVSLLPDLLKRLDQGLVDLGAPRELRDQFFTGLVKCHAVAVRAGLRGVGDAPVAMEPDPLPPPAREALEDLAPTGDFVEIPPVADEVAVDPNLIEEIAAEPEERPEVEEIVIGDVGWLAGGGDPVEKDEHDLKVQTLKRGTWIEYTLEDGSRSRAKLAWVSPMKGIYLFTNRLGQRAMSIDADGLAAKFRSGQVELLDTVPLMERAVSSLLDHLHRKVA
ncbi:MAG: DUF1631 domain-containing protein [Pseudomonadota bacterium]